MNSMLTFLAQNRRRLELERHGVPERLSCVIITPRFRTSQHILFLILPEGAPEPVLVAKVPRLADPNTGLEQETTNLRAIQASRPAGFDSVPRVVAYEESWGRPILLQTALVGQPLDPPTVRRDPAGCCLAITEWLVDLQTATKIDNLAGNGWFERLIDRPLRTLEAFMAPMAGEATLLRRTRVLMEPLRGSTIPLLFEHGDLSHPNILQLKDGGPGVLDWELAEPNGLPGCDLLFFLTYVAFALHKSRETGNYLPAYQEAFFSRSAWTLPYLESYAGQLQLPPALFTSMLVATWVRYLAGLLDRLDNNEHSPASPDPKTLSWLRANRYYALWQYTLNHIDDLGWHQPGDMIG